MHVGMTYRAAGVMPERRYRAANVVMGNVASSALDSRQLLAGMTWCGWIPTNFARREA